MTQYLSSRHIVTGLFSYLYFRKYSEKHNYAGEFPISETLYRQALLEQDRNFEEINRGTFYQSAAKTDDILDPEVGIYLI